MATKFDFDIQHYSLEELLQLFSLPIHGQYTPEDMARCKKQVLFMHPDKSKLPPEYFLFYKKSFSIIVDFYNNQIKIDQPVPTFPSNYTVKETENIDHIVQDKVKNMDSNVFQKKFNQLYHDYVGDQIKNKQRNSWFQDESNPYSTSKQANNVKEINDQIEQIKENKQQQQMVLHKEFHEIHQSGGGANFYEEQDEDENTYIASDMFGKLKYDDIKRVHKDETILSIGEVDFKNKQTFQSVDDLHQFRTNDPLKHADNPQYILDLKEKQGNQQIKTKAFESRKRTMDYEEKNKSILSQFLLLK